jgi:hypothetical protein
MEPQIWHRLDFSALKFNGFILETFVSVFFLENIPNNVCNLQYAADVLFNNPESTGLIML